MTATEIPVTATRKPGRRPAIVPQFDTEDNGRKLAIICSKGALDMAYPGLVLANAALGEGIETHLFFTFWGFEIINKKTMNDLKFTVLGNPATHMPQGIGGLPWMTSMATAKMKKSIAEVGVRRSPNSSSRSSPPAATSGRAGCPPT